MQPFLYCSLIPSSSLGSSEIYVLSVLLKPLSCLGLTIIDR
jgi:hypothetical protein